MYEPPIEILIEKMNLEFEENVVRAVQKCGIDVNRDELLKALQYDRGQYEKGYRDGLLHRADEWISVEERLPEPLERVVAFDSRGNMFTAVYISHMTGKNAWCSPLCYCGEVTHWMPLPGPPENP